MKNFIAFVVFMIFNIFFLLYGVAIIGGSIFLFIKLGFNSLSIVLIILGIIIISTFISGLKSKKKYILLKIYLIVIIILLLFYIGLSFLLYFNPERLVEIIQKKLQESLQKLKEVNKDIINSILIAL